MRALAAGGFAPAVAFTVYNAVQGDAFGAAANAFLASMWLTLFLYANRKVTP